MIPEKWEPVFGQDHAQKRRLLGRLHRFRQVIERQDDVLGQCVGERRAFMGVAHQADMAARQFRETIGRR